MYSTNLPDMSRYLRGVQRSGEISFLTEPLLDHHRDVEQTRLIFLPAFLKAITSVIDKYADREQLGPVLEIGCGNGFFYKWLAPDWLKCRLLCLDVNLENLQDLREKAPHAQTIHANGYSLPIQDRKLPAVIGYSSFDSFIDLEELLIGVKRTLKPNGKLILFQDIFPPPDVYEWSAGNPTQSVERYHRRLVECTKRAGYKILAGETDSLEEYLVEPFDEIKSRVEVAIEKNPLVVLWDRGKSNPALRQSDIEESGVSKLEVENSIDEHVRNNRNVQKSLEEVGCNPDDVLEIVMLRYLVAEPLN